MSGVKFYVLGGGRWREVEVSSGVVAGWGGARFVSWRGGRLRAERRAPVLRGLRALAAAAPTTVTDGPPLSQIRYDKVVRRRRARSSCRCRAPCPLMHCGLGVPNGLNPSGPTPSAPARRAEAPAARAHAAVQADLPPPAAPSAFARNGRRKRSPVDNGRTEMKVPKRRSAKPKSTDGDRSSSVAGLGGECCKELIITDEDVSLLRRFLERDERNVFRVDLARFDADDRYKSRVFYMLNPLVTVERCAAVDAAAGALGAPAASLRDFLRELGLRRVSGDPPARRALRPRPPDAGSEQDKENRLAAGRPPPAGRSARVLRETVGGRANRDRGDGDRRAAAGTHARSTEPDVGAPGNGGGSARAKPTAPEKRGGAGREYSAAEDAAIVSWVRGADRGRRVNGNRLWRELQPLHQRQTGHFRSWHSLRNRYLRYVLPALGELLPPRAAADLRAAAAAGEAKRAPRRNSLLLPPPAPSAWSRRRRESPPPASPPPAASPPRPPPSRSRSAVAERTARLRNTDSDRSRALRPGAAARTPTYRELTERFADRRRSTPDSRASEPDRTERRASKRTRASRDASGDSPARRAPRYRRLYNHDA